MMAVAGDQGDAVVDLSEGTLMELSVCGRNLLKGAFSKPSPFCILYSKNRETFQWQEKNRTETIIDNANPEFARKFMIDFLFGDVVQIKLELYDGNKDSNDLSKLNFLGGLEMMLDEIVSAKKGVQRNLIGPKSNCGQIFIIGQEMEHCKSLLYMEWAGEKLDKKDMFGKSDPFLVFLRKNANEGFTVVHRTEVIKNTLDPKWRPFEVSLGKFCNRDSNAKLKIECWDWNSNGKHSYIGELHTTLNLLKSGQRYNCVNQKKKQKMGEGKYINSGQLHLANMNMIHKPTFVEYLQAGTEIHCTFAIDFGQTNGALHILKPYHPNLYEQALKAVGTVMENYDKDNSFPAFGYGAEHSKGFFHLNSHPRNPSCKNLDGVLQSYGDSVKSVSPSSLTHMAPTIEHVARLADGAPPGEHYHVLVILTSGTVHDMPQTCAAIVNAASLPLSIILVGIGDRDFKDMVTLDGDEVRLTAGSKRAERDIVQFVPFRDHVRPGESEDVSQRRLARAVLEEVPDQLLSYMDSKKIKPLTPQDTNL